MSEERKITGAEILVKINSELNKKSYGNNIQNWIFLPPNEWESLRDYLQPIVEESIWGSHMHSGKALESGYENFMFRGSAICLSEEDRSMDEILYNLREKITGVCVDIPTLIKEKKSEKKEFTPITMSKDALDASLDEDAFLKVVEERFKKAKERLIMEYREEQRAALRDRTND